MKKFFAATIILLITSIGYTDSFKDKLCQIVDGKIKVEIIYNSGRVLGIINPDNTNEVLFFSRVHYKDLYNIHLWDVKTLAELLLVIDETVEKKLGWADGFLIESGQGKYSEYGHLYIRVYRPQGLEKLKYILITPFI